MSIKEMFAGVKDSIKTVDKESLDARLEALKGMVKRATVTGQDKLLIKLSDEEKYIQKQYDILHSKDFNQYVTKSELSDMINDLEDKDLKHLKLTELSNYMHDIPQKVVDKIVEAKPYFNDFIILHTVYGKEQKDTDKQREIEKDPIVFGILDNSESVDDKNYDWSDRYYFIADWVDEYCDFDLDSYLSYYENKGLIKKDIMHTGE